jgi:phosphatidylserine decarboxylase
MRFAPESIPFAAACAALAAIALWLGGPGWAAGPVAALLFVLYFFRDPVRAFVPEAGAILSPADGRVVQVSRVDDALFGGQGAQRVSIFLSIFNVHVNRSPVEGEVQKVVYSRGRFRAAFHGKASEENERNRIEIATDRGPLAVTQIAGAIARRIVCDATSLRETA